MIVAACLKSVITKFVVNLEEEGRVEAVIAGTSPCTGRISL